MLTKTFYLLAASLLLISGCTHTPTTAKHSENLSFMDTDVFDKNLSSSMSADTETISIAITGDVSINQIPNRLGNWLSAVVDKQGQVEVEPKTRSLGLAAIFGLLPAAYQYLKKEFLYGDAEDYNATIFYDRDTGLVNKVVFTKRAK